jgi:predicted peptidase
MRVHFTNALRIGSHIYASSGDFGPAPLTCIEAATGSIVWQDRTFSKASLVRAGDQIVLLDEDGEQAIVALSPQGLKVQAMHSVFSGNAWTVPTLDGHRLGLRDRKKIMALGL